MRRFWGFGVVCLGLFGMMGGVMAEERSVVVLPAPVLASDIPVMQALKERQSRREFSDKAMSRQELANVLWAATGQNRPDGRRTSPSALNGQDVEVYAVTAEGIFLYDAAKHGLVTVVSGDHRAEAGMQPYVGLAPLSLVYVSDAAKLRQVSPKMSPADAHDIGIADAALAAENVYLYASAAKLGVVLRWSIDREAFGRRLGLSADKRVVLAQTLGNLK